LPVSSEIAAAMRTLSLPEPPPSQTTAAAAAPLTEAQKPPLHTTLEVDLTDVLEEPNQRAQTRPIGTALPTGAQKQSAHTTLEVDLTDVLEEPDQRPQTRPMVSALPTPAQQKSISTTLEVDLTDVLEESSRRPVAVASPRHPPPPPPKLAKPLPERSSAAASVAFRNGVELRKRGQYAQAIGELEKVLDDPMQGARAALLLGLCFREQNRFPEAIASFMRGVNMPAAREADLSELFYELGQTHELARDPKEAVVFFQLSLGSSGGFRDAAARIHTLQQVLRRSR
ncbi:tetratricopeptide repeat protein, partial [Haliangium sp. UPWRP_2]|uniref:tetratricopeptide repeat protein n=1 Tax=Haliangium sp. UPWRP_2 TaxID=1931276 RepID=UPI0011B23B31